VYKCIIMFFSLQHGLESAVDFEINVLSPNLVEADVIACMVFSCIMLSHYEEQSLF
jgi:hypothetical protein